MPEIEQLAVLLVRLLGCAFVVLAFVQGIANVLDSINAYHPGHAAYYFRSQLMRPTVLNVAGIGLLLFSRTVGGWLAGGLGP